MRKKIIQLGLCVTLCVSMMACNKEPDTNTRTETEEQVSATLTYDGVRSAQMDISADDVIGKLAEYKNVPVTISGNYEVKDELVEETILSLLNYYGRGTVEVTDKTVVETGDYVLIDYTGYRDGVAFENGAATDVIMDPANNMDVSTQGRYIDGFCADMIGASVGTELETKVTFPEQYPNNPDLAGQPAVFKVKIKGIYRAAGMDDITDETVKELFSANGMETKKALIDYVKEMLLSRAENTKAQDTQTAVQEYIIANSTLEIPREYLDARVAEVEYSTALDNCEEGQTLEEFLKSRGTDLETERATWELDLNRQIKIELLFGKIADLENIQVDEEEFSRYVDYIIQSESTKFKTAEDVYAYYGVGIAEDGEKALRQLYRVTKAVSFVADNAKVTIEQQKEE